MSWPRLLEAPALMFVAYTGYGRIATLGEEVRNPASVIPRAMVLALAVTLLLYGAVAAALLISGQVALDSQAGEGAGLLPAAWLMGGSIAGSVVAAAAVTAMLGVLLNLLLGLSRVVLAMGRRGDLPPGLAALDSAGQSPRLAVLLVGCVIAVLAGLGSIHAAWSFSAFTVLAYYALTNLAALRMPAAERRYPRWIACAGLLGCLSLAAFIEGRIALWGLALLACGVLWRLAYRSIASRRSSV